MIKTYQLDQKYCTLLYIIDGISPVKQYWLCNSCSRLFNLIWKTVVKCIVNKKWHNIDPISFIYIEKKISINLYYDCNILNHKTKINWNNRIENLAERFMSWRQTWLKDVLIYFRVPNTYCNVIFPPDNFRFWMCNILHVWWKGSMLYRKLTNRITGKYIWVTMGYKPLNILINTLSRTDSYEMRRVIREHKLLSVVFFGH